MISSLILQLAKGIWFIEPASAAAYKPVVQAILTGKNVDFSGLMPKSYKDDGGDSERKPIQTFVYSTSVSGSTPRTETFGELSKAPQGSIAVTPLHGVVMKEDFCGAPGTKTLSALMELADGSPNISAHILHTDSPGGSANAMFDMTEVLKRLNKPVLTFVDGMMASAAYGIGSTSKHIMASHAMNSIGSIGTYITLYDYAKAMEMEGIREITIYATKSTEKNADYRAALDGDEKPMLATVDKYNEAFLSVVRRNRFSKNLNESETLKGQLHFTPEALSSGLIDSVGSFPEAIQKVQSLLKP